jgi:hypothetical protein
VEAIARLEHEGVDAMERRVAAASAG